MHDLATIVRLNEKAHGEEIRRLRASGKHVVARYAGLHLLTHAAFDNFEAARAAARDPVDASERLELLPATLNAPHDGTGYIDEVAA